MLHQHTAGLEQLDWDLCDAWVWWTSMVIEGAEKQTRVTSAVRQLLQESVAFSAKTTELRTSKLNTR